MSNTMRKGSKAKTAWARKELLLAGIVFTLALVGIVVFSGESEPSVTTDDGSVFGLDIADTPAERRLGLGGRESLADDRGMLFVFDQPQRSSFWMKDVSFSIDIIWLDEDFTVVHIEDEVSPDTFPEKFTSNLDALYVLEIASGQAENTSIELGETLSVSL